ncbi:ABC transporter ATP-binding protein/permease [Kibdelosporangium philippinense]|uniref:ABC transporter ATP-binding protein/permease n=1 Tax=Kibdelosporangium philippinense TaxID=211113 RepID=A0ABS8ZHR8_9PSEU|nr:ABC transporter ATP-binding protein [Kibdelosporangium philippinense]MCE7006460.1 ABC transporter ATP-binding protein/permease [Kibdelosporangium philippinense]
MTSGGSVLRRAITGQRRDVVAASVLAAGHQGGEALVPVVIGLTIDQAVSGGSVSALLRWIAVLGAVFIMLSFSWRFSTRCGERAMERAAHEIRTKLTERVLDPRGGAETKHLPGALVNIATSDAKRVGAINGVIAYAVAALVGLVVSAIALLNMSIWLGLLVLLGTPPLLVLGHLIGRPLERRSDEEQDRAAHASGVAADLIAGLRVLKGIGAERAAIERYRQTSQDSLGATIRAARARAWHDGALLSLTGIFIAIVALVGGKLAVSGDISIGDLVAAVALSLFLQTPFALFSYANGQFAQSRASAQRVAEVLDAEPAVSGGAGKVAEFSGQVRMSGVRHGTLKDLRLDVAPGELVGVVATDPASATDMLACLGRDIDPAEGVVELDGHNLSTLDIEHARSAILVAAHDAVLFEGTLLENVTAAARGPVDRAMVAASANEVASTLPDGADSEISERGRSLSGGQRQRVALARALAADPPVLVIHDPTTAVDSVTEARIAKDLKEIRNGRTTVALTTSPALLAETDRVVLVHDGVVVAEGTHTELVDSNEVYRGTVLS